MHHTIIKTPAIETSQRQARGKLLAVCATTIILGLGSVSEAQDSSAEIATLSASGVKDWVQINQDILNHPRVDDKSKATSLRELNALRTRIGVLQGDLDDSATALVHRRILTGAMSDIERLLNRHAPPKNTDEISREHRALAAPQTRSEQQAQIDRLNVMIDECNKAINELFKRRRSGAITQEQLHNQMHGENGYDRLRLTLIHRKDKIRKTMLQAETERRRARDRARGSVMDQLGNRHTGRGMSPEDRRRAAAAALSDDD